MSVDDFLVVSVDFLVVSVDDFFVVSADFLVVVVVDDFFMSFLVVVEAGVVVVDVSVLLVLQELRSAATARQVME